MADWSPNLYLRFADERTQPARDLATRVVLTAERPRIIDLGCGPGNSTAVLRARWSEAREITGLDSSPAMIEAARKSHREGRWEVADASAWTDPTGEGYDLVFSNAVFHWVPNHAELFPRLLAQVKPGGALAVQMPAKAYPALHKLIVETADSELAWRERTQHSRGVIRVLDPGAYYDLLSPRATRIEIWETRYHHVMDHARRRDRLAALHRPAALARRVAQRRGPRALRGSPAAGSRRDLPGAGRRKGALPVRPALHRGVSA